jgi:hypothetical protein
MWRWYLFASTLAITVLGIISISNTKGKLQSTTFSISDEPIWPPPLPTIPIKPITPPLTIIFIHGLGKPAERPWTDANTGYFWPPWLLKVHGLENAHIMTFAYDSSWSNIWNANNVLDISDFASQLALDLWSYYNENGDVTCYQMVLFNLIVTDSFYRS